MGRQQVLLIVVGVVIIGIAMVVGIQMFTAMPPTKGNLEAVALDIESLVDRAHQYFAKPTSMGYGGDSFAGLTADPAGLSKLAAKPTNDNGMFSIVVAGSATEVVLQGDGLEDNDRDGVNVRVMAWVRADPEHDLIVVVSR